VRELPCDGGYRVLYEVEDDVIIVVRVDKILT